MSQVSYSTIRKEMRWPQKNGHIKLSMMSDKHIKSCLEYLRNNPHTSPNGYSSTYWVMMFQSELRYRSLAVKHMIQIVDEFFPNLRLGKTIQAHIKTQVHSK